MDAPDRKHMRVISRIRAQLESAKADVLGISIVDLRIAEAADRFEERMRHATGALEDILFIIDPNYDWSDDDPAQRQPEAP